MAPQRTIFDLQFLKGIRTNASNHLQLEGELLSLENGQLTKLGEIEKRLGYDSLAQTIYGGGSIGSGRGLQVFNDELLNFDGYHVYSWSPGLTTWLDRGVAKSTIVDTEIVVHNDGYQQTVPTMAVNGNLEVHAWQDERGGLRYSLLDTQTRAMIVADAVLHATATECRAIAFGGKLVLVYSLGSNNFVKYKTIDSTGALSGETTIDTATQSGDFDICVATSGATSKLFIAYAVSGQNCTKTLSTSFVLSSVFQVAGVSSSIRCCFADSSGEVFVGYGVGNAVHGYCVNFANTATVVAVKTTVMVDGVGETNGSGHSLTTNRITGYCSGTTAHFYCEDTSFLASGSPQGAWRIKIIHNTLTTGGVVGTQNIFMRSVGLFGKPFSYASNWYIPVAHESAQQATCFIADDGANLVAKILYQVSGGLESKAGAISMTSSVEDGKFVFDVLQTGRQISQADGYGDTTLFFSRLGVTRVQVDFTSQNAFVSTIANNQLLIAGGVVQTYDRSAVHELNFHLYPENVAVAGTTGGSLNLLGLYQYKVLYRWTDALGNDHTSRPSTSAELTLTGSNNAGALTIPYLRLTNKTGVRIEIYRTKDAGSTFRQVSSQITPIYNETSLDSFTFTDTLADSALDAAPLLYSEGESVNLAPSNAKIALTFKDRVFLAGLEDRNVIKFTKYLAPGVAPEFCEDAIFSQVVDGFGGEITELSILGDQLVIFKERAIYSMISEGPSDAGEAALYGDTGVPLVRPTPLSLTIGCVRPNCVAAIPPGLIFVSHTGIYILSDSLSYIGERVKAFEGLTFTSVDPVVGTTQVRFTTLEGTMLIYDYQKDAWFSWTNLDAVDAAVWNDSHVFLNSSGRVSVQKTSSSTLPYQDTDGYVNMSLESGWYFPNGGAGYVQLDKLFITGDYLSEHDLDVEVSIDERDVVKRSWTVDATNGMSVQYMVELSPFLKCKSFKIGLSEDGGGSSATWSGLRAVILPLPNSYRLPSYRRNP